MWLPRSTVQHHRVHTAITLSFQPQKHPFLFNILRRASQSKQQELLIAALEAIKMGKDDSSIPSWQRVANDDKPSESSTETPPTPDQSASINNDLAHAEAAAQRMPDFAGTDVDELAPVPTREDAARFLDHPGTKNAAVDDKIRFLEVKGVQQADIEALIPEAKKIYAAERNAELQAFAKESAQEAQGTPPVVTYPEFLIRRTKPPPLVTTNFLLNTLYATAGSIAGMYALSKYVLGPMHEELSEARHDFFTHASDKLGDIGSKMSGMVSVQPASKQAGSDRIADNVSESSHDSDPTELYHRDIGIQTSPPQSRRGSHADGATKVADEDTLTKQTKRLAALSSQLRGLESFRKATGEKEKDIHDQLDSFSTYLNELMYTSPYYSYKGYTPSWSTAPANSSANDEFDKFRQEVRSMKGLMLSARNFPRGGA